MTRSSATTGPWTFRDVSGAGLQISATLPAGFKFEGTAREADGRTSFLIWTLRESCSVQIADERWVQFSTGSWEEMQKANARLIAEAGTVLHETGLSPRELADDRDRLREALTYIAGTLDLESYPDNGSVESRLGNKARSALAQREPQAGSKSEGAQ